MEGKKEEEKEGNWWDSQSSKEGVIEANWTWTVRQTKHNKGEEAEIQKGRGNVSDGWKCLQTKTQKTTLRKTGKEREIMETKANLLREEAKSGSVEREKKTQVETLNRDTISIS